MVADPKEGEANISSTTANTCTPSSEAGAANSSLDGIQLDASVYGQVKEDHPNTACQDTVDSPPVKTSVNRSRGRTTSDIHRINAASDVTRGTSRTTEVNILFDQHDQHTEAHDSDESA